MSVKGKSGGARLYAFLHKLYYRLVALLVPLTQAPGTYNPDQDHFLRRHDVFSLLSRLLQVLVQMCKMCNIIFWS